MTKKKILDPLFLWDKKQFQIHLRVEFRNAQKQKQKIQINL